MMTNKIQKKNNIQCQLEDDPTKSEIFRKTHSIKPELNLMLLKGWHFQNGLAQGTLCKNNLKLSKAN